MLKPLTNRDLEVLRELEAYCRSTPRWARPLDVGGWNGSHHSATLAKLVRRGLVRRKVRSPGERGSLAYRISDEGKRLVEQEHADEDR